MSERAVKAHYCNVCRKYFQFYSKLKRHEESKSHRILAERKKTKSPNLPSPVLAQEAESMYSPASTTMEEAADSLVVSQFQQNRYTPFESKCEAMMFILMNSLRPVSESVVTFQLFATRQLYPTTPSLTRLKNIKLPGYTPPEKFYSPNGTPFYVRKPSTILSLCLSNEFIAKKINRYPVLSDGPCREMYEAERWNNELMYHSPMAVGCDDLHVFAGDIVLFHYDGGLVCAKILTFVKEKSSERLMVRAILIVDVDDEEAEGFVMLGDEALINVMDIVEVVTDSQMFHRGNIFWKATPESVMEPLTDGQWKALKDVHPSKSSSNGLPVFTLPLILYSDDTSGNRSKKWNKFDVWALLLAGLPRSDNANMENIHMITASNQASALDMAIPIVEDLQVLEEEGITIYDAYLQQNVKIFAKVIAIICDNGRATEIFNLCGSSGRRYCRMCLCDKANTPHKVSKQRTKQQAISQIALIQQCGSEQGKKELRCKYGLKENYNPLFTLNIDPYRCSPVECLHTLLLGPYKYLVERLMRRLTPKDKDKIEAKIVALPQSGLPCKPPATICRYYGSLNGRDFKVFAQVCLFALWDHLSKAERDVWLSLSKVFKLAYCEYFDPSSLKEAENICNGFVMAVKNYDAKLLDKQKIHLLLHLPQSMAQFGPTASFNTERCERFNGVVRDYNIHSNRKACSRDIVTRFAKFEALQLLKNGKGEHTERCGSALRDLLETPQVVHFMYGTPYKDIFKMKEIHQPGTLRKKTDRTTTLRDMQVTVKGKQTTLQHMKQLGINLRLKGIPLSTLATQYQAVVDQNSVLINNEDTLTFKLEDRQVKWGKLIASFATMDGQEGCLIQPFDELRAQDEKILNEFDCPLLQLEDEIITVKPKSITRVCSILHECTHTCKCQTTKQFPSRELIEHEDIPSRKALTYTHDYTNTMYALNIYCCKFASQ